MAKSYTLFATKNTSDNFAIGLKVERSKTTIAAVGEGSFVATDGLKMFIVGEAEALEGIKKSDTGFGSTCGATPAKVQELSDILADMGFTVDVTIAYAAIDKVSVYPAKVTTPVYENDEDFGDDQVHYGLDVPSDKEDMIEEALELAATIANVEDESDAFVVICEFYLKNNKKA